ncbi:hypothetical protein LTR36_004559 [Oleoguttula mirabilis]|uniref:Uncharacterized protein n=1 Tax=Oleoguttula mirabilis TaxID=1507867 RepID=A0AAV9JG93_9PEZI|nr:hypothetical protein LTR36_004559 [Oleoguttula mirabilis]
MDWSPTTLPDAAPLPTQRESAVNQDSGTTSTKSTYDADTPKACTAEELLVYPTRAEKTDHGFRFETSKGVYTTNSGHRAQWKPAKVDEELQKHMLKEFREDEHEETGATGVVSVIYIGDLNLFVHGFTHVHKAHDAVRVPTDSELLIGILHDRSDWLVWRSKATKYFRRVCRILELLFGGQGVTYTCKEEQVQHKLVCDIPLAVLRTGIKFAEDLMAQDPWGVDPSSPEWQGTSPLKLLSQKHLDRIIQSSRSLEEETVIDKIVRWRQCFQLPSYTYRNLRLASACLTHDEGLELDRLRMESPWLIGKPGPPDIEVKSEDGELPAGLKTSDMVRILDYKLKTGSTEVLYEAVRSTGATEWRSLGCLVDEGCAGSVIHFLAFCAHTRSVQGQRQCVEQRRKP